MQEARRNLNKLTPPICEEKLFEALERYMDNYIDAYLGFMGDSLTDSEISDLIVKALSNELIIMQEIIKLEERLNN